MSDKSGIYGYNQQLSQFKKLPKELFLKKVEAFLICPDFMKAISA